MWRGLLNCGSGTLLPRAPEKLLSLLCFILLSTLPRCEVHCARGFRAVGELACAHGAWVGAPRCEALSCARNRTPAVRGENATRGGCFQVFR